MQRNLSHLLQEIQQLEAAVAARLRKKERKFFYVVLNRKVAFKDADRVAHRAGRMTTLKFLTSASFLSLLTAPVIYGFIVPALILDLSVGLYQAVIFPVYAIPKVKRSDYIALDRGQLLYLNWLERINCDYCGYVNGLVAYTREIASRTEQYFCPIRHAIQTLAPHPRHSYFLPYGDAVEYHAKVKKLQAQLRRTTKA